MATTEGRALHQHRRLHMVHTIQRSLLNRLILFFVLGIIPTLAAASPRFVEQQQRQHQLGGEGGGQSNALSLRSRYSGGLKGQQGPQRINVSEALRKFRFNRARPNTGDDNDSAAAAGDTTVEADGALQERRHDDSAGASGPSSSLQAPSDKDQLADIALVVSVDGSIHAIKRDSGHWVWSLHDDNPSAQRDDIVRAPLVKSTAPVSRSGSSNATGPGVAGGDQDEVYIIEPSSGGDIYLYHKSTGSLQKLPLSVSQLVELSPYDDKAQDGKLFVGKKETKLVGVDLQTGKLVGVFGPEAGWCEWQSLWDQHGAAGQAGTGDVPAFSSCAGSDVDLDSIENRPRDLLYLGRTDYHISIFSKTQGLLQTLHYTSYGPSSMASSGLPSTLYGDPGHMGTAVSPDGRYIQPMHEGTLACFHDDDSDGLQWTTHLSSPIVAVFDVIHPAISTHAADSQTKTATERHLQPSLHPHPTQSAHTVLDNLSHMAPRAYVGVLDATGVAIAADDEQPLYFAMSSGHFPLISFAPAPEEDQQQPWLPRSDNIGRLGDSHSGQDKSRPRFGLLGAHIIQGPPDSGKTIDAPPDVPSIDGPPSVSRQPLHRDEPYPAPSKPKQAPPTPALPPYRDKVPSAKRTEDAALDTIVSRRRIGLKFSIESLLVLAGILAFSLFALRRQLRRRAVRGLLDAKALVRSSDKRLEPQGSSDGATPSQDAIPAARTGHRRANGHSSSASMDKALPALPVEPADVTVSTERDRHAASDGDLPAGGALPPTEEESSEKEDEGFEGSENVKDGVKNPKKGRRRKRGKRTAAKAGTDQNEVPAASRAEEGEVPQIVVAPSAKPATVGKAPEEAGRIGSLTVSDSIIGYGSHGTVVLKGTFQGRAVAVKRLLKDFVTVASHEVKLLQESDSHSNVIRYFCKEADPSENFLYIALELCPASLFELVDTPKLFPELVEAFDPCKALKEITKGLQHLHKLKIIHRDLKPQNILVAVTPSAPPSSKLRRQPSSRAIMGSESPATTALAVDRPLQEIRMVISDFGLCKKLDLDESSFLQSTRGGGNHAAGSFGYRAPEVLRGEVDANDLVNTSGAAVDSPSASTASTLTSAPTRSSSSSALLDGEAGTGQGRKLTRSIDIFSLGCIFYFVLTLGEHPFGSRYEREVNILNDKIGLDGLSVMTENRHEAQQLIQAMCAGDAHFRPTAGEILLDPLFWSPSKSLHFLCDASDRFEIMEREAQVVLDLEASAKQVVGSDWLRNGLDRNLVDNLGKYRKYDGGSVRDLMRVLRNKKHHYQDLPENVRKSLGEPPAGFLSYFTKRFPKLLLCVHGVVKDHLSHERMFAPYFAPDDG